MSWVSSRNASRGGGRDEAQKAAKWLMRQSLKAQEQSDAQTVFLLNLLQEHRQELEARDAVMRESTLLVSKLQHEIKTLKEQVLEKDVQVSVSSRCRAGGAAPPSAFGASASDGGTLAPPTWRQRCITKPSNLGESVGGSSVDSPRPGNAYTYSTLQEAWARVRCGSDTSSVQPPPTPSSEEVMPTCREAPFSPTTPPSRSHLSAASTTLSSDSRSSTAGAAASTSVPLSSNSPTMRPGDPVAVGLGAEHAQQQSGAAAEAVQPPERRPLHELPHYQQRQPQDPSRRVSGAHSQPMPHPPNPQQNPDAPVQYSASQSSQQDLRPNARQEPQHDGEGGTTGGTQQQQQQHESLRAQVASMQTQLATARHDASTARSDYLTCRKDLEILTRKYDNLMLQKLEVEEQRDRLFSPHLDVKLIRAAMPAVDAALAVAEERLAGATGMLAACQAEAEDAARAQNQQRKKWIIRLEAAQEQLDERDARLAQLEEREARLKQLEEREARLEQIEEREARLAGLEAREARLAHLEAREARLTAVEAQLADALAALTPSAAALAAARQEGSCGRGAVVTTPT